MADSSQLSLKQLNEVSRGDIIGIIILGGRLYGSTFSESGKEYLLSIASMAGIALHNTLLNEMATTDMMTKLKIHHYFQTFLIDEIERTRTHNKPLSLIMADVDHFKDLNDTYGHAAGDLVLMNVARLIMENIRQMDIAARYGGEEFAIILPDTDIKEALIVAERIRHGIEMSSIKYDNKDLTTTISIGVTQYNPEQDTTKNALVERADKALYNSKRNGRNLVTCL